MRALAWKLAEGVFACATITACGDGGTGNQGESGGSSSESTEGEVTDPDSDPSSESGPIPTGTCTAWSTVGSKADVFIPADAAPSDACAPAVAACGGDPHGTWTLDASCGYDLTPLQNPFAQFCPGGGFSATTPTRTGTLTVDEVGHYTLHVATVHSFTFGSAVIDCFSNWNCDAATAEEMAEAVGGGTGTCVGGPPSCDCEITGIEKDVVTAEGQLRGADALSFSDGSSAYPYCVGDGQLAVWSVSEVAMPTSTACATDADCSDIAPGTIGACMPN